MAQNKLGSHSAQLNLANFNTPTNAAPSMSSEDDMLADVDEPPDLQRTPRPSALKLHDSFKGAFEKHAPRYQRQTSLLSTALHSNETSPIEEHDDVPRGMSCTSTWSNNSISTAELTSDGGITSPGTRTSTPSPPLPPVSSHNMLPISTKPLEREVTIVRYDGEHVVPVLKDPPVPVVSENKVEAGLGRKRCITFACGGKKEAKPEPQAAKTVPEPQQSEEPPKRPCTIKFACPTKISTDAPAKTRVARAASPAPPPRVRNSSKASLKAHRGSDSTIRNPSPVSVRRPRMSDRSRRLSSNSDLARTEAFRFHEFASSEEEVEEWTQESTCHRRPLTIKDTLIIENNLRQLGEEAEEEALEDDEEEDDVLEDDDELDEDDEDAEDDDAEEEEEAEDSDAADASSDEGFQTDNEEGFAVSDDDSDAGSDYNWWTPGRSTAATSIEHLDLIRPSSGRRSISESSVGSVESSHRFVPEVKIKRRKSRPVNIRVPSPELPDSTDFVCGTLDEDRPLEQAYLSALERRRQARHKKTPQDVDPTFPTSDPELDEEDEDSEPDHLASESDHFMLHGQMDALNGDLRGRRKSVPARRSPAQSPKRLRSPAPIKRAVHRSPPPRKLFGQSPKRMRSPAPARLKSPPPTRRGSSFLVEPAKRTTMSIQFAGLAERPVPTMTSSLPRTPVTQNPPEIDYDDEDTPNEFPVRRAIDIKVGLERKRQRRREQLYKKMQKQKCHKDKRPAPGKGAERMREVGLGLAAHKGKVAAAGFAFNVPHTPDQKDMHVLSV
ncbi:hypothetical protein DPSP01_005704 [Paraphaeosphaeria sporulosa]|uniref:Extensin domain-containing protein n=1 Tax=Paraphaeosphaeria sporulosa TaxID=1460663 RepID=A0A177CUB1_9PLEO|nr:uncharacterized protein CC84DRAFT_482212 [Paraphaeosphaeria sporulosa]OAG10349.1 hypothetical protein CC84DRAFT_482212 [Paraphaeosphaeria sporulosa]